MFNLRGRRENMDLNEGLLRDDRETLGYMILPEYRIGRRTRSRDATEDELSFPHMFYIS